MKEYFYSKLLSMWKSTKLLTFLVCFPSAYEREFNSSVDKFSTGLDAFKFTTLLCVFFAAIFNEQLVSGNNKIDFSDMLVDLWLLIVLIGLSAFIMLKICYRDHEGISDFLGSVVFSLSSCLAVGTLITSMSMSYYNEISPQTSFGSGDSLDHFLRGIDYLVYPLLLLLIFVVYITFLNAYVAKKSGKMTFKMAFVVLWLAIFLGFWILELVGEDISKVLAKWLQAFLALFA